MCKLTSPSYPWAMFSYSLYGAGCCPCLVVVSECTHMDYLWEEEKDKCKGDDSQQLINEGMVTKKFMSGISVPYGKN